MANFTYKRTETTAMKIVGVIDTDKLTVLVDEEEKSLAALLPDFNSGCVEINVKTKNEEELDAPTSENE